MFVLIGIGLVFPVSLCCVTADELYDAATESVLYLSDIKRQSACHSMRPKRSEADLVRAKQPDSSAPVLLTSHTKDFYMIWVGRETVVVSASKKNFIKPSTLHVLGI